MAWGMPEGFAALIQRKYDLMQQQADTAKLGMVASSNLDTVKAGLLPREAEVAAGLGLAQTRLAGANARNVDETTRLAAPLANASILNSTAQGGLYGAEASALNRDATRGIAVGSGFGIGSRFKYRGLSGPGYDDDLLRSRSRFGMELGN